MSYQEEYRQKLTSAGEAVKVVKSGDWLDYGWTVCSPNALDKALAARMGELKDVNIRVPLQYVRHDRLADRGGRSG